MGTRTLTKAHVRLRPWHASAHIPHLAYILAPEVRSGFARDVMNEYCHHASSSSQVGSSVQLSTIQIQRRTLTQLRQVSLLTLCTHSTSTDLFRTMSTSKLRGECAAEVEDEQRGLERSRSDLNVRSMYSAGEPLEGKRASRSSVSCHLDAVP